MADWVRDFLGLETRTGLDFDTPSKHSPCVQSGDIVALFVDCFPTYLKGGATRRHLRVGGGGGGRSESEDLGHGSAGMLHALAAGDLGLGAERPRAGSWVSHFHLPGSTVCPVFPFYNVVLLEADEVVQGVL